MNKPTSIDDQELSKFNKTMDQWWDKAGEFKLLHQINPVRIAYILDKIHEHFASNDEIELLDVGSGGGIVCSALHRQGLKITGLDANEHNTKAAKEHDPDIEYINDTVENYLEQNKKYDVVLALEVIEHVANPQDFVQNMTKLLKPKGIIILSTINRTAKSYLLAIIMAEYVLRFMPKGTHDYQKFLKPSDLSHMLLKSNMKITELKGLCLDIFSQKWQLSDDIDVNYFAVIGNRQ